MEKYSSITIITIITASQSHNSLKFATMNEGKEQGRNKVCKTKNVLPISNNEIHNKVMYHARLIWHRDVTKERSFASENRDFREYFGCGTNVVVHMWMLLVEHDLIYSGLTTIEKLLWTLLFLKTYNSESILCNLVGIKDPKRFRETVWVVLELIAELEP